MASLLSGLRHYTVKPKDTLAGISQSFYGTPEYAVYIYQHNSRYIPDMNQLSVGQVITIPYLNEKHAVEHLLRKAMR